MRLEVRCNGVGYLTRDGGTTWPDGQIGNESTQNISVQRKRIWDISKRGMPLELLVLSQIASISNGRPVYSEGGIPKFEHHEIQFDKDVTSLQDSLSHEEAMEQPNEYVISAVMKTH